MDRVTASEHAQAAFFLFEQVGCAEQGHLPLERAFEPDGEIVAEHGERLRRHHVAVAREMMHGGLDVGAHLQPGERAEILFARHRSGALAGDCDAAEPRMQFALDGDAVVQERVGAGGEELAVLDAGGPAARREAAEDHAVGRAFEFARGGEGSGQGHFAQRILAGIDAQPVHEFHADLRTGGQAERAFERQVQIRGDPGDAALDLLQEKPGVPERDVQVVRADRHAVQVAIHDAEGPAERILDPRKLHVPGGGEGVVPLVDLQGHVRELELADLEVRHLELADDIPGVFALFVCDADEVFVAGQVDHELQVPARSGRPLAEFPLHLALEFQFHARFGPVHGQRDSHVRQVERQPEDLGVDVVRQDVGNLRDMILLRTLQHVGVMFRSELADHRDLLRHHDEFQRAFVVQVCRVLRLHHEIPGLHPVALHDERGPLDLRIRQGAVVRSGDGDGRDFGRSGHLGSQFDGVFRFRILSVFEPEHVGGLAVQRRVVDDGPQVGRLFALGPLFLPFQLVAVHLELDFPVGGGIAEFQFPAVEHLLRAAEVHHDIRHRHGVHRADVRLEGVLPVPHVEAAVQVVERVVGDGHVVDADVAALVVETGGFGDPGGIVGEVFDLSEDVVMFILVYPLRLRVVGDGEVAQIELDRDGGGRDHVRQCHARGVDGAAQQSPFSDAERSLDLGVVQLAAVVHVHYAAFDHQIVYHGVAVDQGITFRGIGSFYEGSSVADVHSAGFDRDVAGRAAEIHLQPAVIKSGQIVFLIVVSGPIRAVVSDDGAVLEHGMENDVFPVWGVIIPLPAIP